MKKKFMRQKGYSFYSRIDTDGVGCSITFIKTEYRRMVFKPKFKINKDPYQLITSLTKEQLEEFKNRTLVGLDPGKSVLALLADDKGRHVKYTSYQRRYESYQKYAKEVTEQIRRKNKILEEEKKLNEHNSKTMDVEKFKDFIRVKSEVSEKVREHYNQLLYRKFKLRSFVNGRSSVDKFLNKIEKTFGPNVVIGYGNWSRNSQMKYQPPTMGKGLRCQIHRRYPTYTIDEYGTSIHCHKCGRELKNHYNGSSKIHRCLVCKGCLSLENKKGVQTRFINRDINGALNIQKCLKEWVNKQRRPECLQRACSKGEEGTSQALNQRSVG